MIQHPWAKPMGAPIKSWTEGVEFEKKAWDQVHNLARMPFIFSHVAVMPDVHFGIGATVGSVFATKKALIPAAVGVDIGCGMQAVRTNFTSHSFGDNAESLRATIEMTVPHGTPSKKNTRVGSWGNPPFRVQHDWSHLLPGYLKITEKHPKIAHPGAPLQLGTLGGGNHFIELCLDKEDRVWIMLHSGSRGAGNRIGTYFTELAKKEMLRLDRTLPDVDLAYLEEGTEHFSDYWEALSWAQKYAAWNRNIMMIAVVNSVFNGPGIHQWYPEEEVIDCHHNYASLETHYGEQVYVTRKGAVRAAKGVLGIIPGSMGARTYIVRGKGSVESFESCSHGAGRVMSRSQAKKEISIEEHAKATEGVACRKDAGVLDESPAAYKNIDAVMKAQEDLVEIVHTLKAFVCVKG